MVVVVQRPTLTVRKRTVARPASFSIGNLSKRQIRFDVSKPKPEVLEPFAPLTLQPGRRFEASVWMHMGRRGKGKTLGMSAIADVQKERFEYYKTGQRVGANYWLECADILNPQLVEWFNSDGLLDSRSRRMWACVDEATSQFMNRRSMSAVNVDFSQILTQIRKLETCMTFTTQFPQWVDIAILYQIDLFMLMEANYDASIIDCYVFDWWGQLTGNMNRKAWPPQMSDVDWQVTLYNTDYMFNRYRTDQIVPPAWFKGPRKQDVINKQWGDHMSLVDDMVDVPGKIDTADMQEIAIGGEVTPHAANMLSLGNPSSIEELLDRQSQKPFSVAGLLGRAKQIDNTIVDFATWLHRLNVLGVETWTESGVRYGAYKP